MYVRTVYSVHPIVADYQTVLLSDLHLSLCACILDTLTGWLSIPNKTNIKKSGYWKKQFVLVSTKKILFYDSENDKEESNPSMVIDLE